MGNGFVQNNPNGLFLYPIVGMDAGWLDILIIRAYRWFSCDSESGFGGNFNNLQEM
jgi:hypothetical protein